MKRLDYEAVENALLTWELALAGGKQIVTAELVGLWLAILQDERVTGEEFDRAALKVLKDARFMPKPAEVLDVIRAVRSDAKALESRKRFEGAVAFTDENGVGVLALGEAAKALPEPAKALPEPAREILPEERAERIKKLSPGAAKWLIGILRDSGQDVSAEVQALKEANEERARKKQAEAERRDAEQAAKVKAQAEAMRKGNE